MAKLRFSREVLEDLIFGFAANPVRITGVSVSLDHGEIVFDVEGRDVPVAPEVQAICTVQENRARQRLITMVFEAVK